MGVRDLEREDKVNICALLRRKEDVLVTVVMTVVTNVVKGAGFVGSKTREEVRGPLAATTEPAATKKRKGTLVGIGRGEERGREGEEVNGVKASV